MVTLTHYTANTVLPLLIRNMSILKNAPITLIEEGDFKVTYDPSDKGFFIYNGEYETRVPEFKDIIIPAMVVLKKEQHIIYNAFFGVILEELDKYIAKNEKKED